MPESISGIESKLWVMLLSSDRCTIEGKCTPKHQFIAVAGYNLRLKFSPDCSNTHGTKDFVNSFRFMIGFLPVVAVGVCHSILSCDSTLLSILILFRMLETYKYTILTFPYQRDLLLTWSKCEFGDCGTRRLQIEFKLEVLAVGFI